MLVTVRSSMYADYDKSIVLRLPGEVLSEIIGSSCGSYSAYLYRLRESRRADSKRCPHLIASLLEYVLIRPDASVNCADLGDLR
jgi:hypothetical protein